MKKRLLVFSVSLCLCAENALSITPIIRELQINPEIPRLEQSNDFLQSIAVFPADSHQISLDRSLHLLLRILDQLHDVARLFDRDALQEIIALLKSRDFGIDLQFTNYRTN